MNQQSLVTVEWLYGERLVIITVTESSSAALSDWAKTMKELLQTPSQDRTLYVAHDLAAIRIAQATQVPRYAQQIVDVGRSRKAHVTLIVSSPIFAQLANLFLSGQRGANVPKIVASREQAVQWLSRIAQENREPFA